MILEQTEKNVLRALLALDKTGEGARYQDILDFVKRRSDWSIDLLEEQVSHLIDEGSLYEPILGYLKVTDPDDITPLNLDLQDPKIEILPPRKKVWDLQVRGLDGGTRDFLEPLLRRMEIPFLFQERVVQ